ncbi:MAG: 30S ribosome-binding factor RbfA [Dehalococcoidales bacterium]|nr:30S ribosome-binding factor RbfA [Dehalococcoidales bacterium]
MTRRVERVNSVIQQELSEVLQRQAKDPRLGCFVTVNEVSTSPDLSYARVLVSCIDIEADKNKILRGLTAASGFFRNELSRRLSLRRIPELDFQWDDSIERADRILKLLDEVRTDGESQ